MPWRPCIRCGVLVLGASYCQAHEPVRTTPGRASRAQSMFRATVLHNSGWRCDWINAEDGSRCEVRTNLQAHHMAPFRDTGSMRAEDGCALCREHHELAERALEQMRATPAV